MKTTGSVDRFVTFVMARQLGQSISKPTGLVGGNWYTGVSEE